MVIEKKEKEFLFKKLGFKLINGESDKWAIEIDQYFITLDLSDVDSAKWSIDYGSDIIVHRKTTSNFSKEENLVVLECVIRLLKMGYPAQAIELEKQWKVGGYLDIYVKDDANKAYLMIECKTWGKEYNKALKITLENNTKKEQILNYYLQDQNAQYLCFYTSQIMASGNIDYISNIIYTKSFEKANNQEEIYELWDKVYYTKGIFESSIKPYHVKFLGITNKDLKPIEHSYVSYESNNEGSIFNRFAEILRRHTISDQSNAYNKIFNLFLCKIVDEDNAVDEDYEMEFQWKYKENPTDVIYRLSDLYKKGMQDYMELEIADVSEDDFNSELLRIAPSSTNETRALKDMFMKLRLYKNNEFAFKEIINEQTFNENADIVKEVVKLLEQHKIKYEHKQRFLGDFFERLLNVGVKQAAGQFFTPLPVTTFISHSIPVETIINEKIQNKDNNFLPYIIDYACGSGHFLNDGMDRIDKIVQSLDEKKFKTKTQQDNFYTWKRAYKWAKEFVYGIEKDYRLAKTTKVACFLNGDGEAKIIYGDGLAPFSSDSYKGILKKTGGEQKENPVFDVIMANPPFSVENFKMVLKDGKDSFNLYSKVTEKSDDIECFFIERTYQLLKEDGYVGIILPSTILLNKGVHQESRKIILEHFDIYAICEFGSKTFTYAGQPTIAMFMKKRKTIVRDEITKIIKNFAETKTDFAYNGVKNVVSKYVELSGIYDNLEEFLEATKCKKTSERELEKLRYYLFNINRKTIIANSLEKDKMKEFLGYEHSSMAKYEGIHPYPHNDDGHIISKLYHDTNLQDPDKLSTLIYNNFLNQEVKISHSLEEFAEIKDFNEMLDYSDAIFNHRINLQSLKNPYLSFNKYPLVSLSNKEMNIVQILDDMRQPVKKSKRGAGKYNYYGANGITGKIGAFIFDEKLVLIGEDGAKWGKGEPTAFTINGKSWVNNHAHVIRTEPNLLLPEYLELVFTRLDFSFLKTRPNGGKLQKGEMVKIKFPLPDIITQANIIKRISKLSGENKWDEFDLLLK